MQIKLIALSSNEIMAYSSATKMISNSIAQITNTKPQTFSFCGSQKSMFVELDQGFKSADLIVLAVDLPMYVSTKGVLFKALGLKCKKSKEILDIIHSDACISNLNDAQADAHAAVPVGAEVFVTEDGLFSGFALKANKQKLMMLPIDDKRLIHILPRQIRAFVTEGMDLSSDEVPSDTIVQEKIKQSAAVSMFIKEDNDAEEEQSEEPQTEEKEAPAEEEDVVKKALEAMQSKNMQVSFAKQNNNLLVEAILEKRNELHNSDAIRIVKIADDAVQADGGENEYKIAVANAARKAMKAGHTAIGASVSSVYMDVTGNHYIFAAIACNDKASVFKIFAIDGETEEDLVCTGIESVFEALLEKAETYEGTVLSAPSAQNEKKSLSMGVKIGIWLIIVITLCTVIALLVDYFLGERESAQMAGELISAMTRYLN